MEKSKPTDGVVKWFFGFIEFKEIGVDVRSAERLYEHTHTYPEKSVRLDIWCVTEWLGEPQSVEGQPLEWVDVSELPDWPLPEADAPAVQRLMERVERT